MQLYQVGRSARKISAPDAQHGESAYVESCFIFRFIAVDNLQNVRLNGERKVAKMRKGVEARKARKWACERLPEVQDLHNRS